MSRASARRATKEIAALYQITVGKCKPLRCRRDRVGAKLEPGFERGKSYL